MILRRRAVDPWSNGPDRRSLLVAGAVWTALLVPLLVIGCSVDSKGLEGFDAGAGGTGTGATSASGGKSAGTGGVTGSGGVPAAGGNVGSGSGGAPASGGTPGSGGHTGGVAAGGHVGSGSGGLGAGGRTGSGGTAGGAGHEGSGTGGKSMGTGGSGGNGGTAGAGGHGGRSGETCDQLVDDYAKAVTEARACTPGATDQCQQMASGTLSFCNGCPQVIVNDTTRLTAIRAQWTAAGCAVPTVCPAIACVVPPMRTCTSSNGPGGTCEASGVSPN